MGRFARRTTALLAGLALFVSIPAFAQQPGRAEARATSRPAAAATAQEGKPSINLDEARRRWERLSPEEQDRLRERYEKLRHMGEADRRELERRRRHLEHMQRRVLERLSEADSARLAALPQGERDRLLREMVEDELHLEAQRLEEKLPNNWRERLQNADPQDRRRFFKEFKRQVNREWNPRALEDLGAELGVPPAEIESWQQLPLEQQKRKLLELGKRHRRAAVNQHGLPEGMSPEEWKRIEQLPPESFFEEAMRLRAARGWEPGRPFFGEPPAGEDEAWRDGARRFRRASRPRPEDRLEFSHLPPEQRRAQVDQRRRERLLGALSDSGLVAPAEIDSMRALPEQEFWQRARHWNEELRLDLGRRGPRRQGDRGGRESGPPPHEAGSPPPGPPPHSRGRGEQGPKDDAPPPRQRGDRRPGSKGEGAPPHEGGAPPPRQRGDRKPGSKGKGAPPQGDGAPPPERGRRDRDS